MWLWVIYLAGVAGMVFICLDACEEMAEKSIQFDANRDMFPIISIVLGLMWPGVLLGYVYWKLENK